MPAIFKIFLFFLLKGGIGVLKNDYGILMCDDINRQSSFMPKITILNLQGDPTALEEAITICEEYQPSEVQRELSNGLPQGSNALLRFEKIAEENRSRLSHQLILRLTGRVFVEWKVEE